jgi:hypothetical protein
MVAADLINKFEEEEATVPTQWRPTLSEILERFKCGDFMLAGKIDGVDHISATDAEVISSNIQSYGEDLVSLPDDTWTTSISRWMRGYWQVLVDIYSEGGLSDLVLFVKVYESGSSYRFEVQSVHVP